MLSGVSKFLFGYSSATESTKECQEVDLKTQVTDEDWILVETENKDATPTEPHPDAAATAAAAEASLNKSCQSTDTTIVTSVVSETDDAGSSHNEQTLAIFHLDTDSDDSPLPRSPEVLCFISGCPSDSWIMDPPPCFTASQEGSLSMSMLSTPMENLLLEHPSMSVYDSYSRTIHSDGEDSDNTDNEGNDDEPDNLLVEERRPSTPFEEVTLPIMPITRPTPTAARPAPAPCPQPPAQTLRVVLQRQSYQQTRYINKKNLNRSNKIHEYSHLGKRQRHRARYQCPSGRMNGRIGQRRAY